MSLSSPPVQIAHWAHIRHFLSVWMHGPDQKPGTVNQLNLTTVTFSILKTQTYLAQLGKLCFFKED